MTKQVSEEAILFYGESPDSHVRAIVRELLAFRAQQKSLAVTKAQFDDALAVIQEQADCIADSEKVLYPGSPFLGTWDDSDEAHQAKAEHDRLIAAIEVLHILYASPQPAAPAPAQDSVLVPRQVLTVLVHVARQEIDKTGGTRMAILAWRQGSELLDAALSRQSEPAAQKEGK